MLTDDETEGPGARDTLSWVKLGSSLVGADAPYAGIPHRVEIGVYEPDDGPPAFGIRAWRIDCQPEDFDPEEEIEPFLLTDKIVGMNCRTLSNDQEDDVEAELEWDDGWEETNRIPFAVEITLYLQSPREGDEPVEVRRIAEIPLAELSWSGTGVVSPLRREGSNHSSAPSTDSSDDFGNSGSSGGSRNTGGSRRQPREEGREPGGPGRFGGAGAEGGAGGEGGGGGFGIRRDRP